jgi:Flp pilus assembly protein TadG
MTRWPLRGDSGNAAVEIAPVSLIFVAFLALIAATGRITVAQTAITGAARDAARQASIARTPEAAQAAATQSALATLRSDGLDCDPAVTINTGGFSVPVGQPAQVTATVTCAVRLSGLLVPGIPGSRTITGTSSSPLDPFRGR